MHLQRKGVTMKKLGTDVDGEIESWSLARLVQYKNNAKKHPAVFFRELSDAASYVAGLSGGELDFVDGALAERPVLEPVDLGFTLGGLDDDSEGHLAFPFTALVYVTFKVLNKRANRHFAGYRAPRRSKTKCYKTRGLRVSYA
jgi:hypothetical protein